MAGHNNDADNPAKSKLERSKEGMENKHSNNEDTKILIAEDNEINQKVMSAFLSRRGYKNICASNGKEAVDIAFGSEVDLILMDVQMPVLNGFEATKIIRESEKESKKHMPIIAMTAYAMTGDCEKCIEAGMDDYISKPITANELYERIERALGLSY